MIVVIIILIMIIVIVIVIIVILVRLLIMLLRACLSSFQLSSSTLSTSAQPPGLWCPRCVTASWSSSVRSESLCSRLRLRMPRRAKDVADWSAAARPPEAAPESASASSSAGGSPACTSSAPPTTATTGLAASHAARPESSKLQLVLSYFTGYV